MSADERSAVASRQRAAWVFLLLGLLALGMRVSGVHWHLCADGLEKPLSLHWSEPGLSDELEHAKAALHDGDQCIGAEAIATAAPQRGAAGQMAPHTAADCVSRSLAPPPPLRTLWFATVLMVLLLPVRVLGSDSEIHVYDDSIASPGTFNLTAHNYYVASGARSAAFGGGVVPDHSLTGGTEWTYGALRCSSAAPIFPSSVTHGVVD